MSRVLLVAEDPAGREVHRAPLAHGADPEVLLRNSGWIPQWRGGTVGTDGWTLHYRVEPGPTPRPHQRAAAYAVVFAPGPPNDISGGPAVDRSESAQEVTSAEAGSGDIVPAAGASAGGSRLLLTQLADNTNRHGWWGLPGGGIDPGEDPVDAVRREVMEETGQQISAIEPLTVLTQHWVGHAPRGGLEDFHAVRLVYTARCEHPVPTEVHDIGGTTSAAEWVDRQQWGRLAILEWVRPILSRWWA